MSVLGAIICQAIVHEYGRDEFLRRLSHPFWFQSLAPSWAWIGVIGALKYMQYHLLHGILLLMVLAPTPG
jgi:hypothetical protein